MSRTITALAADAPRALTAIRSARAAARATAWALAEEHAPDHDISAASPLVIDLDATLVTSHSDKENARPTFKRGYGFHPLTAFVDHGADGTGEPLAIQLRPGNAGSNTAVDHIEVTRQALRQLPGHRTGTRPGRKVLIRTVPRKRGYPQAPGSAKRSWPGSPASDCRTPPEGVPPRRVRPARRHRRPVTADPRASLGAGLRRRRPGPSRRLGRRSHRPARPPHLAHRHARHRPQGTPPPRRPTTSDRPPQAGVPPVDGHRLTAFATNTTRGQLADLELRHRRRARCEDRIRNAKDSGLRNLPLHGFTANQ